MSDLVKTSSADVQPGEMLPVILQAARDKDIDATKLEKLMEMQFRLEERAADRLLDAAIAEVGLGIPRIPKNGVIKLGDKGNIPFATFEDMDKILRPRLEAAGITLSYDTEFREGGGAIVICIARKAGATRSTRFPLPTDTGPGRNNLQAQGSTLSYGKRYTTEMMFNLVREGADDDGVSGGTRYITEAQKSQLVQLIIDTQSDTGRFCEAFKARSLDEIEVKNFQVALNMLAQKKAKMEKPK